jgi:DNA-binding LacI/PurR family transcriptional regulator
VCPETARKGLKVLESEGLLESEARHGFRVGKDNAALSVNRALAYVTGNPDRLDARPVEWSLSRCLQSAAAERGWIVLGIHGENERILSLLNEGRVWGVILDTLKSSLIEQVRRTGIPVVVVNSMLEGADVDTVIQDNYIGGFLAAQHLIERGIRRIGWLSPVDMFCQYRERFAGASACARAGGCPIPGKHVIEDAQDRDALAKLLSDSGRPEALLVFGMEFAKLLVSVASQLGIRIGKDLQVIGWTVEENYVDVYQNVFFGMRPPDAIVWSARQMADIAVARLRERQRGKAGGVVRISIPTRLRSSREA